MPPEEHEPLPDYSVEFDEERDQVVFRNRGSVSPSLPAEPDVTVAALRPDTYEQARGYAQGWDVYFIEREWRDWLTEPPRNPDAAFLGFCRKW